MKKKKNKGNRIKMHSTIEIR